MRRFVSSTVVAAAVVAATLAWSTWVLTATLLDPAQAGRVADVLVDDPAVREAVSEALGEALVAAVPVSNSLADAELYAAAGRAVDDPRVTAVLRSAILDGHRRFIGDSTGPVQVDAGPIAAAGRDALLSAHPELARTLPAPPPLVVELPTDTLPDLGGVRRAAGRTTPGAARAAAALLVAALVVASDRRQVVRRAGHWALYAGGLWVLIGVLAPWGVSHLAVDGHLAVVGSLAVAVSRPMIAPAAVMVLAGSGALLGARAWSRAIEARRWRTPAGLPVHPMPTPLPGGPPR